MPPSPRRLRGDRSRNATPRNLCHISPFGSSNGGRNGGEEKGDEEEAAARNSAAKRELIAPRGNKRYVRRGAKGRFKESDKVGRSLTVDRRRKAKTVAKRGQGDRGARR